MVRTDGKLARHWGPDGEISARLARWSDDAAQLARGGWSGGEICTAVS